MMKNKILLALSLLAGPVAVAQNTFPSSGNVGIGTLTPKYRFQVAGQHYDTNMGLYYYNPDTTKQANLTLWASEPGWTFTGTGIGNNVYNSPTAQGIIRINTFKGGSYMRLLDQEIRLNVVQLNGTDLSAFAINSIGDIGIGTTSPNTYFHGGNNKVLEISNTNTSPNSQAHIILSTASTEANSSAGSISWVSKNSQNSKGMAYINAVTVGDATVNASSKLCFATASANTPLVRMVLDPDGNVGIGTMTPNEKLSVNGKIRAKEIKVETANWPDYVFTADYKVGTLEELESYIKANKHLPDMPSAKEAEANGVELGEMNKLLLKKQEELVLHLIEQNKRLEKQQQEIDQLKKLVAKLLDK